MLIVYAVVALAQIKLRRVLERDTPDRIVIRMWLFPWLSYAAVIGISLVLVAMAVSPDMRSQFISSTAVSLLCLAVYYWLHGRKERG
jgi:L-asparagine transporter-like permease